MYGTLPKVSSVRSMLCYNYANNYNSIIILSMIGLCKKLDKLAKTKDCEIDGEWVQSIINHLYWCVASTTDGNGEMIRAKWSSLVNHIHNQHTRHGHLFPKCCHGRIRGRRKKKWIKWRNLNKDVVYIHILLYRFKG